MSDRYTVEELLEKVLWEGGFEELFEYGVGPDEVPEALQQSYMIAKRYWQAYMKVADQMYEWLEANSSGDRAEGE